MNEAFEAWWATIDPFDAPHRAAEKASHRAAYLAATERAAGVADRATIGLTGFTESDRMEFCVKNLHKLREAIAAAIREGRAS